MRYLGVCRFSWFGISDTGRAIADLDTARQVLWHPYRMAVRFYLLENIMLPSLIAQTDQDFEFLFISSTAMPDPYRARLETTLKRWPTARVIDTEETNIGRVLKPVMVENTNDGETPAVHFRLDDDDALCSTYIERLKDAAPRLKPGSMISFPKGFMAFTDGHTAKHNQRIRNSIAIGLALVLNPDRMRHIFQMQHGRHWQNVPTYLDPTFFAYQQTLHGVNNTKGYDKTLHLNTSDNDRNTARFSEALEGKIVPEGLDDEIAAAFPFATGPGLRATLESSLKAQDLAEEMGFTGLL